ncbi:MAG: phosphoribosylaminoimidazolesuccinocarboxamide synthase [Deltaproteobacteria bacterium]|nr:phosphoribosylaminoimidazolesuccinocarboxamide synthase [Deltaproteobacteria bacterium]
MSNGGILPGAAAELPKGLRRGAKFYEGKAKILFRTNDRKFVIQYFKDDATAFNAQKRGTIVNKGVMNNEISSLIFAWLAKNGVQSHFTGRLSEREMLVKSLDIVPVEVVMRNIVAGSLSKRMGIPEGQPLKRPILEYYYKKDELGDPPINRDHALVFGLATAKELDQIDRTAHKVNLLLLRLFRSIGIKLVDFKLEFGRHGGKILLGDEITPDGCRLWDTKTNEKMDKDRFRRDLGKIEESYEEVLRRVREKIGPRPVRKGRKQ